MAHYQDPGDCEMLKHHSITMLGDNTRIVGPRTHFSFGYGESL